VGLYVPVTMGLNALADLLRWHSVAQGGAAAVAHRLWRAFHGRRACAARSAWARIRPGVLESARSLGVTGPRLIATGTSALAAALRGPLHYWCWST
jgi:hypothetical protein